MKPDNPYDGRYAGVEFYWGKKPSLLCDKVIELVQPAPDVRPRLLDLGCGEGKDIVYFAQNGFDVVGLDAAASGLAKARSYAVEMGVDIEIIHADLAGYDIEGSFDVIFSSGAFHYLPPEIRIKRFEQYKQATVPGGLHAATVLVEKPFIPKAPDADGTACLFKSGELFGYYWDWEILYCTEEIFDCNSSGVPHKHAVNRVIARRVPVI